MKFIYITILSALLVTGCATTSTENYEKILQTWVGLHVDELVLDWGPPQSSFDLSTGEKIIEYHNVRYVYIPSTSFPRAHTVYRKHPDGSVTTYQTFSEHEIPAQSYTRFCKTRFIINPDGMIKQWDWEGDDCRAEAPK